MSAAFEVVQPGGLIVVAAECRDGFPDYGEFREMLYSMRSPQELLDTLSERRDTVPDQWEAQILARVLCGARVAVHADGLTADELAHASLSCADDIAETVADELRRKGDGATCCALPAGPETIPVAPR
jgi:hypothetical protein